MNTIPVSLITGFLGSGKTTFLKRVMHRLEHRRMVYLINEFSTRDVDARLLAGTADHVMAIPGGSIFCNCLVTEFVSTLRRVHEQFHLPASPLEGVIIEASGMANPKVMSRLLRETRMDAQYRVATIVAVVDPGSFQKLCRTLPNIKTQVESADVILLNKTDLYDEGKNAEVELELKTLNNQARIIRCCRGDAEVDLSQDSVLAPQLVGELAPCRDPNYESHFVDMARPVRLADLKRDLEACRADIYRCKGFISTSAGVQYVDSSFSGVCITPVVDNQGPWGLAMILRSSFAPATQTLLDRLNNGTYDMGR